MRNLKISSSLEDYLEAIAEIIESEKHAHSKEIAEKLKVSTPSVSHALQALAARGLIRYQPHAPVTLTRRGKKLADAIRHRHQVMKCFFANILKLSDEEADDFACKTEHILTEKYKDRFVALADAIENREDCTGLRKYLDEYLPTIEGEDSDIISLDLLPLGHEATVVSISENLPGIKKFADLGLVHGSILQMEGKAPFGDLIRIRVMESRLSMREKDAANIWVKPLNANANAAG
ncbi:MAG: metal-dependent transcriptional regulator [Oligosphaeraceae bacterium]|nr:metal-dependent transcriptional regulator [Oligosphaeraceae bacterium]